MVHFLQQLNDKQYTTRYTYTLTICLLYSHARLGSPLYISYKNRCELLECNIL